MPSLAAPADRGEAEAGFTLVEVLVAFMVIALTLTMALRVLADGTAAGRRGPAQAARIEEAISVLNGIVADLKLQPGDMDGVFADGSRWRVRVADVTGRVVPKAPGRLFRVELFEEAADRKPVFVTMATEPAR